MNFEELLKEAEWFSIGSNEVPVSKRIDRTLEQLIQEAQELISRTRGTRSKNSKVYSWLQSKGIELPQLAEKQDAFEVDSFVSNGPINEDTFEQYVKEEIVLSLVDKVNENIKLDTLKDEWSKEKKLILNTLAGPTQKYVDISGRRQKIKINKLSHCCKQYNIETYFANAVIDYNKHKRNDEYPCDLLRKFSKIVEGRKTKLGNNNQYWSTLVSMVSKWKGKSSIDPIKRRQEKQEEFISQAKRCLEHKYKTYMLSIVEDNLMLAERGGVPSNVSFIKGFVTVYLSLYKMSDLVEKCNGNPLWPHIYFAMRCGELGSVKEFHIEFGSEYVEFFEAIQQKINRPEEGIKPELENRLTEQYMETIRNSKDAFQKAVFCIIIGHHVEESIPLVKPTENDIIWTQLSIVRRHREDRNISQIKELTYVGLQSLILQKYGEDESLIDDSNKQLEYFQLLMYTGQFESGIDFMARIDGKRSHAVHMAIALNELHILSTPRQVHTPLLFTDENDPQPMKRLSLTRLILRYAKCLGLKSHPMEVLNYYSFLRKFKHDDGRNVFLTSVCDLIMLSTDYTQFLGKLHPTGRGRMALGLFDEFADKECNTNILTAMVAEELVVRLKLENAVYFFDLAGLHDRALKLFNKLLTKCLHKPPKPKTMRKRLTRIVKIYKYRFNEKVLIVEPETEDIFKKLHDLVVFFNLYHQKKNNKALKWLSHLHLIPMKHKQFNYCLENFHYLPIEVVRRVPNILLATMTMLYRKCLALKKKCANPKDAEPFLCQIRVKAKNVLHIASSIPYSIPDKINKRLLNLESQMYSLK